MLFKRDKSHIYEPSNERPQILKGIEFYSDSWKNGCGIHSYKKIISLKYVMNRDSYNHVFKDDKYELEINYGEESLKSVTKNIEDVNSELIRVKKIGIGTKGEKVDRLHIIHDYLKSKTYYRRLYRYYMIYLKNGYLDLGTCKLFSNGELHYGDRVVANFLDSFKENLVEFGTERRHSRMFSFANSFEIKINHTKKYSSLFNNSTSIYLYRDRDIVEECILSLINHDVLFSWEPMEFFSSTGVSMEDI